MEPDLVTSDADLLRAYARDGAQPAFAELVRRHVDWVYSSARRQVSDPGLAEDVTQSVFILLARKAATFGAAPMLTVWLFRTTRLIAADARKMRSRRLKHERVAAEQRTERMDDTVMQTTDRSTEWAPIAPILDEAIARLGTTDRQAVLLRFFQHKSHADVAAALGVSEAAAKMRVSRAIERLRGLLARRGVRTASAAALATILSGSAVEPAPAALVASATGCTTGSSAVALTSPVTTSYVTAALTAMGWHKAKLVAALVVASLATSGVVATVLLQGSPQPAVAADAVAPAPDDQRWRPAFDRAYALPDGRALRRIGPPYVAERQEYVRYAFSGSNMTWVDVNKSPQMMVYDYGQEGRPAVTWRNMYHEPPTLHETICAVLQAPKTEVVGPSKLLATKLESDWVCRANSSAAGRAADLERILREECGMKVMIRRKRLPQEVIVATGAVALAPGTAVQVYSDRMTGDRPSTDSISTSLQQFFEQLAVWVDRPVVNESTTPPRQAIPWVVHTSGMVGPMPPKRARVKADMILTNVARQSGLQLRRETRPMDVWEVSLAEAPAKGDK